MKTLLKHSFHFTRWAFAVLILVVMLFLVIGRVLVSYVEDSTAEAVDRLSGVLGVPVSISEVDTEWHGLGPSLVLHDVELGQEGELGSVAMLAVKPNMLSSLRNWSLVWSRFEASGMELEVVEQADGSWQVAGIGIEGSSAGSGFVEKMLLDSRFVSVSDAHVNLTSLSGTGVILRVHDLNLVNSLGFHRLQLDADFGSEQNQLNFIAELHGSAVRFADLDGLAHLEIAAQDATGLYDFFQEKFWPETNLELTTTPLMQAEFWATFQASQEIQIQGQLQFDQIPGSIVGLDSGMAQAQTNLVAVYSEERLQADMIDPAIQMGDEEVVLPSLRLSRIISNQDVTYGLQLPSLNVGYLIESAGEIGIVPESFLDQLSGLELQGVVQRLYMSIPGNNPQGWSVTADLQSFGMNSYRRAPAVRNLSGRVGIDHYGGRVAVDSTDFQILYPQAYDHWLEHESLKGLVAWEINSESRFVHVYSDHLEVESEEGAVIGAFAADVPMFPDHPTGVGLTLYLGLENSGVEHAAGLLPERLPQSLRDWLAQSLVSGTVPQAAMIYRGSTRPGTEAYRTVQLHIEAEDAELDFLPRWPTLMNANADIWISNTDLYVRSQRASLLDLDIANVEVWVDTPPALQGESSDVARQIRISAEASGAANSALDLVRTTNLRDQVGGGLDVLDLHGDIESTIELAMPISNSIQRQDVQANINVFLAGNQLDISDLDLSIPDIHGTLVYDEQGLGAESISARIWDAPINVQIREDEDEAVVYIEGGGELQAQSVTEWLGLNLLSGVEGSMQVAGMLEINTDVSTGKPHIFEFRSDLAGVEASLPEPLAKPAGVEAPILVRMEKGEQLFTRIEWQLPGANDEEKADLLLLETVSNNRSGGVQSASFALGTYLLEHKQGTLKGNVQLSSLALQPWIDFFDSEELMAGSSDGNVMGLMPEFTFDVSSLSIGNADFGHLSADLDYQDDAWNFSLETAYANGTYQYFTGASQLPLLRLEQIDINAYLEQADADGVAQGASEEDAFIDPRDFPEMRVELDSVIYEGTNRGQWKGEFRPMENGLRIGNLEGGLGSAMLNQEEGRSSIFWGVDSYGQYTETNFTFSYEDIGDLFSTLNMNAPLNSTSGILYGSLQWQGSPFEFSGSALNGIMGVDASEGEFFTGSNNVNPLLKTIGLFNAGAWTRRLQLDFKDVTSEGTYFNHLVGDFVLDGGSITTLTPVTINMSSGSMLFDGVVDLNLDQVEAKLVVTLPARQNMTWVTALVGGLPAAAGVWLASMIFDDELDSLSSVSYQVTGPVDDPEVKAERVFDSTITN